MTTLQEHLHEWRQHNFPHSDATQQLLGVVEEVGELAHVVLKLKQKIRNMDEASARELIIDAVGDIQIFLAGFCSYEGIDMRMALEVTAGEVLQRDWITYPHNGRTK